MVCTDALSCQLGVVAKIWHRTGHRKREAGNRDSIFYCRMRGLRWCLRYVWAIDYSLQFAGVGRSAAHLHTRERNTTHYKLFDYPGAGVGDWVTLPMFHSYFPVLNAFQSSNGSRVLDLNLEGSTTKNITNAARGVYDAATSGCIGWFSSSPMAAKMFGPQFLKAPFPKLEKASL